MSEKRGRGQPKFEPTQDQRSQVKLMKAVGIPEDRICKTITNPRTGKPVAPMKLARAFAAELELRRTGVVAAACTQGKRTQHGKPLCVIRDDQPDAREGQATQGRRENIVGRISAELGCL